MDDATIRKVLETPYWPITLETDTEYRRQHDDHDGDPKGGLMVTVDRMGDVYIATDRGPWLRFRTFGGGGRSERTRAALLVLAEGIRLDNSDHPQTELAVGEGSGKDRQAWKREVLIAYAREWLGEHYPKGEGEGAEEERWMERLGLLVDFITDAAVALEGRRV